MSASFAAEATSRRRSPSRPSGPKRAVDWATARTLLIGYVQSAASSKTFPEALAGESPRSAAGSAESADSVAVRLAHAGGSKSDAGRGGAAQVSGEGGTAR